MSKPRFLIRAQSNNHQVEVWINNIPVLFLRQGESPAPVIIPVNQFLIAGSNKIGVMLHAGVMPSQADKPWPIDKEAARYTGQSSVLVTIAKYGPGETGTADTPPPLASLRWEGVASPRPNYLEQQFTHVGASHVWAWESATQFRTLDGDLRAQVLDYIRRLHGLLQTQNFDGFLTESSLKLEEMTEHAYGVPAAPMRQNMLEALQAHSAQPFRLQALDEASIDMRLIASGRMLECIRKDRTHVLQFVNSETQDTFFLPLMIGLAGNRFRLLR